MYTGHRGVMTSPDGSVIAWIAPDGASGVKPVNFVPFCGSPSSGAGAEGAGAGADAEGTGAKGPCPVGVLRAGAEDVKQPEAKTIATSAVFIWSMLRHRVALSGWEFGKAWQSRCTHQVGLLPRGCHITTRWQRRMQRPMHSSACDSGHRLR